MYGLTLTYQHFRGTYCFISQAENYYIFIKLRYLNDNVFTLSASPLKHVVECVQYYVVLYVLHSHINETKNTPASFWISVVTDYSLNKLRIIRSYVIEFDVFCYFMVS